MHPNLLDWLLFFVTVAYFLHLYIYIFFFFYPKNITYLSKTNYFGVEYCRGWRLLIFQRECFSVPRVPCLQGLTFPCPALSWNGSSQTTRTFIKGSCVLFVDLTTMQVSDVTPLETYASNLRVMLTWGFDHLNCLWLCSSSFGKNNWTLWVGLKFGHASSLHCLTHIRLCFILINNQNILTPTG